MEVKAGQTVQVVQVPVGTRYVVSETDTGDYADLTETMAGTVVAGDGARGTFTNNKNFALTVEHVYFAADGSEMKVTSKDAVETLFGAAVHETKADKDGYILTNIVMTPSNKTEIVDKTAGVITATMPAQDAVIRFEYAPRTDLSYTVEYREDSETGSVLYPSKTETGKTFGKTYTENAVDIKGYKVDQETKTVTMATGVNKIVFIYTKDDGQTQKTTYTVKHTIEGVEQTADTRNYEDTAWINEKNPTIVVDVYKRQTTRSISKVCRACWSCTRPQRIMRPCTRWRTCLLYTSRCV